MIWKTSRSIAGSGAGLLVVLIAFLVMMYMAASSLGQSFAGSLFGLVILAFVVLAAFVFAGVKGNSGMRF